MSGLRERLGMGESGMVRSSSYRKRQAKISILPELGLFHPLHACHARSLLGNKVDPSLLDHVQIPYRWSEYLYHVGSSLNTHSIIHSGLNAGGTDTKERRQTVFFIALDPVNNSKEEEYQDVSKPRKIHYKNKWKVFQDAMYL